MKGLAVYKLHCVSLRYFCGYSWTLPYNVAGNVSILAVLAGVWIRIEVTSRFEWSNWLRQQGAWSSPRFHAVSGRMLPQTMFKLQSPHTQFLVLRGLNWVQKSELFGFPVVSQILMYSQLPITRTFKGNQKTFELSEVQVIGSSKK